MRERTYWADHVLSETNKFMVIAVQGDIYTITPYGTVMQQGTYQDAAHFNSMEEALVANEEATLILLDFARHNKEQLEAAEAHIDELYATETGTVTLTNTAKFPFNNSKSTVALNKNRDTGNYVVVVEVTAAKGNVGEIIVSDQLVNGFKIEYTGSASSATISYKVIGGWSK